MWPYDQSVHPPAPFLDVVLRHPANPQVTQRLPAKVDTGADISAVPLSIVNEFNLSRASTIPVEGLVNGQLQINADPQHQGTSLPCYLVSLHA